MEEMRQDGDALQELSRMMGVWCDCCSKQIESEGEDGASEPTRYIPQRRL